MTISDALSSDKSLSMFGHLSKLAEELLVHESINLPHIMKVLGDRPYPLKESIREYLKELEKRQKEEEEKKEVDAAE